MKRFAIVTFVIYFVLAAFVLVMCELVIPALSNVTTASPSGVNNGAMFGANFFRPFGWIVAAALVALAPFTLLIRVVDELGDRLAGWVRGGNK
jgi:hypothetical protein